MSLVIFEKNKPLVLQALQDGEFDYIEAASEVFETDFFKYIGAKGILEKAAQSYPTPRKKQEVPLWFYIASDLSMRLHGVHSFDAYPTVVQTGGMLNAFCPRVGRKTIHPDTKQVTVACEGFNEKNIYDRQTPCDSDFLRKLAKQTPAEKLMRWMNTDLARVLHTQRAFDKEGLFIGDASYLFVPDNPKYEQSVKMLFGEDDHPIDKEEFNALSDERKLRCQWRRCYKMVTLMHTNATRDFYLMVGVKIVSGKPNECPIFYQLLKEVVEALGMGVIRKLILDRGFLDGEQIARCKKDYGVDVLIPVRKSMNIYADAMSLFKQPDVNWTTCESPRLPDEEPPRLKPPIVRARERKRQATLKERKVEQTTAQPSADTIVVTREAAAISDFTSWDSCSVPLSVIANREHYADGHQETWLLLSTQRICDAPAARQEYHLRTSIEERYRQFKCFADLSKFSSRAFTLIVNHVVFTLLAYNLLQLYLLHNGPRKSNQSTPLSVRRELLPVNNYTIVYWQNYYGLFTPMELIELMTVGVSEQARLKIGRKCQRLQGELRSTLNNPRPP